MRTTVFIQDFFWKFSTQVRRKNTSDFKLHLVYIFIDYLLYLTEWIYWQTIYTNRKSFITKILVRMVNIFRCRVKSMRKNSFFKIGFILLVQNPRKIHLHKIDNITYLVLYRFRDTNSNTKTLSRLDFFLFSEKEISNNPYYLPSMVNLYFRSKLRLFFQNSVGSVWCPWWRMNERTQFSFSQITSN